VAAPTGGQLKIDIEFPGRTVSVGVWKLQVGRIPLLLLDSDLPENDDGDRPITHTLYVRGREMRFCQELILGVGAVRAIDALGIAPAVWHVNEGHAAMSVLERTRQLCRHGIGFEQAMDEVRRRTLFTLHTPVPAGNEVFEASLASRYTKPWADALGLDQAGLGKLASSRGDPNEFDLGALAIRHAAITNGVSVRHAEVATHDWQHLIGGPAIAVTNGVHTPSWIGRDAERMLTGVFGPEWATEILDRPDAIELLRRVPDQTIWSAHQTRKELLTRFVRSRLRRQLARHGVSPDELRAVDGILPADVLTIGFARRFATYKRATLMFSDWHRLVRILANEERPVHVIFAGKAHPADRPAQHLIRHIIELSRTPELKGRVFFLEDYEAKVARYMVQGCDVWANNPRPPMEASGTSGMKAAINGTLNLSVLDGWWMEGYNGKNGWKFGSPDGHDNHDHQDSLDAQSFYEVLEAEVVPLYYDRGPDGIPHGWVETMRESMISTLVSFSTHRMVKAYAENAYYPLSAIT
jgi:starch phosphorylase